VGYILTTNFCGVYFNDNSKIILQPDNYTIEYFEKGLDKVERKEQHNLKTFPNDIKKKVTLLIHFKNYMEGVKNKSEMPQAIKVSGSPDTVFVKKWMKTKHAILFRLSNKVV
jgi:polo-like kinase 1